MKLAHDWKAILRHAWSVRFLGLALACEGAQLGLPYLPAFLFLPPSLVSAMMGLLVVAAGVARLVQQQTLDGREVTWRNADGTLLIVGGRVYAVVTPEGGRA